ncbi:MAG: PQQ-binding-like beta-propeller repeat protein [Pirellulaceae bacterium]
MNSPVRWSSAVALCALACGSLPFVAADWPEWRGPTGQGHSHESDAPTTWSATEQVKWKVPLDGPGNSTPIVVGTQVFLTHSPAKSTARGLHAYDRATGKLLWKHEVDYPQPEPTHNTNPFCSASPASDGERVVAWYGSAGLFCYGLDGRILWQKDLGKVEHIWGYGSSPAIHENLVILNFGPGLNAFVAAFDKQTGEEVWRREFPGQKSAKIDEFRGSWSTPVVATIGNRALLLLSLPQTLRALEAQTGADIWSCAGLSDLVYTSPLVAGDIVIAMGGYGGAALAVPATGEGDVTARRLWHHERKNPQRVGSGVVVKDHLYILNEPGQAWCLDVKTGERAWEERLPGGNSWSSMSHVAGRLYISNTAGTTFVLEPNPAECKIIAENKLDELTRGSHAFAGGEIFVRTYQHLYCIEGK